MQQFKEGQLIVYRNGDQYEMAIASSVSCRWLGHTVYCTDKKDMA